MMRAFSHRSLFLTLAIALAPFAVQAQATGGVTCKDGTTSTATGRGACSGHGGVDKQAKAAKSDAKVAKSNAKASSKAPKAEVKADAKETKAEAKADTKSATKSTKAAEKATSKTVSSDVRETGKAANATVAPTRTRTAVNTDPTDATAKCKDGTYSHAATHRGACSRHGGVAEWLKG
jgi:ABC-type Na+ efflux pump permease subunit